MILKIFSHLMMSRMLLSSSCVLVFLLFLSHECNGRHLGSIDEHAMDDKAKLVTHTTINGFGNNPFIVHDNHKMIKKGKDQPNTVDDHQHKQTDCRSKNKKDMIKDPKVRKANEDPAHRQNQPKFVTFRVPPKNKRVHQQPGFNLDYSPPKTHPPSHN